jgi:hypothetical protein
VDEDNFTFLRQQLRGIVNHGLHYGFRNHRETLHKDYVISKLGFITVALDFRLHLEEVLEFALIVVFQTQFDNSWL